MRVLIGLICLLSPGPAFGQTWTASVMGGTGFAGDSTLTRPAGGLALALGLPRGLSLEAEAGLTGMTPSGGRASWLRSMAGSLMGQMFRHAPLKPYVSAGGALTSQSARPPGSRGLRPALVLAGGVLAGRGRWRVRADLRHIHVDNAPNVWRASVGLSRSLTL